MSTDTTDHVSNAYTANTDPQKQEVNFDTDNKHVITATSTEKIKIEEEWIINLKTGAFKRTNFTDHNTDSPDPFWEVNVPWEPKEIVFNNIDKPTLLTTLSELCEELLKVDTNINIKNPDDEYDLTINTTDP